MGKNEMQHFEKPRLWEVPEIDGLTREALPVIESVLLARLRDIAKQHENPMFATSLAVEDMVITDVIARHGLAIEIFTLDTGRLNPETQALRQRAEAHFGISIRAYQPDSDSAADFDAQNGLDAMYRSLDLRHECCGIRKVEPLNRALQHADAWLTGQRREQAATRIELPFEENDTQRGMKKYNPIADWSETLVWGYILTHGVPYNDLYHQGYPSIGCAPCSKPVRAGEDIRAGRWWWERKTSKECGLHVK